MAHVWKQGACVLALFLLLTTVSLSHSDCNIPSAFWCDNTDIAKQCGVYEQCQSWQRFDGHDAPLVQFALYYESLCAQCIFFLIRNLKQAQQEVHSIMNVTLVPYGNARETYDGKKWIFSCQNGASECQGNIIETCAINKVKNFADYFPFILCLERSTQFAVDPTRAARVCARKHPVPIEQILKCSTSDEGNQMQHQMALKTGALKPPLTSVPWVTLNGVHTARIQREAIGNLVMLICVTYTGHPKPPVCP